MENFINHSVDEGSAAYSDPYSSYCPISLLETKLVSRRTKNEYIPVRKISYGHFSTVFLCYCIQLKRFVAVKICRADPEYEQAFEDELDILRDINDSIDRTPELKDKENGHIVQLIDWFKYEEPRVEDEF